MVAAIHACPPELRVEFIDPLAGDAWDDEVTAISGHTVFHRAAWAMVLAETYGHRPYYLRVSEGETVAALVPVMEVHSRFTGRRGVSLPFSDFAGPLWTGPTHLGVYQVLQELTVERKWGHLEIRGGPPPLGGARPFHCYAAHQINLVPGDQCLAGNLPSTTWRAIRRAERSGLTVSVERGEDAMEDFYRLHGRTRRRHGLPPQPVTFFLSIGRHLIDAGLGEIVMGRSRGEAVAGAVFLHSGGRAIYKFGASEPAFWGLRPNHLVMWHAIRHLAQLGCTSLNLGRSSCDDHGLRRFKHSWGCDEDMLNYFRYSDSRMAWIENQPHATESHPFLFGHLPVVLNRVAGRLIYPHLD